MFRLRSVMLSKLARELWQRKGSLAALMLVTAVGVATFVSMIGVYLDLNASRARFYRDCRLTDFTLDLKRAPEPALAMAARLPNVRELEGRINLVVRVQLPGADEPLAGRAISLPNPRRPIINDLRLTQGTWFTPQAERQTIVNEAFAKANHLRPGDTLKVILRGQEQTFTIVGRARSPEFVYVIPPGGAVVPDPARAPIIYLPQRVLRRAGNLDGAFNQVVGKVYDHSPEALRRTLAELERALDPYGVTLATPASDLASVQFLHSDISSLRVTATIMPLICLGVMALVLNLVVSRLVTQQRTSIGTLRAIGYSSGFMVRHYLGYGWAVGVTGGLAGIGIGMWMQRGLLAMYRRFYELPDVRARAHPEVILIGFLVGLACALAGTVAGARSAARLDPAEAMRPPPPEIGREILLERLPWLWRPLPFRWKMVLRAVFRNPFRTGVTCVAALLGTALVVESLSMIAAVNYLVDYEFQTISHEDVTVMLRDPVGRSGLEDFLHLRGITTAEPQLSVPCELIAGSREKRTSVTGLPAEGRLYTLLNARQEPVRVPRSGLVLSSKLAHILRLHPGDSVRIRALLGERREAVAPVVGTVNSYIGLGAYTRIPYLSRLIGESWACNSILATTTTGREQTALLQELARRPMVLSANWRRTTLRKMRQILDESIGVSLVFIIVFAGVLAFGSVLNTALISLSERQREVGTLRVLGYTPSQVTQIFAGESLLVNGLGIVLGWGLGIWLVVEISHAYNTDLLRFPVLIQPRVLAESTLLLAIFVGLAQLVVYSLIRKIPWLDVLKVRE